MHVSGMLAWCMRACLPFEKLRMAYGFEIRAGPLNLRPAAGARKKCQVGFYIFHMKIFSF